MTVEINRTSVEEYRKFSLDFSLVRGWNCFWNPRNYILALVGEFGELVELFEGLDDEKLPFIETANPQLYQLLCEELSDNLLYLFAFCGCAGVNLTKVALNPSVAVEIDFTAEFPISFDRDIYFDDLIKKILPEIQELSLFTLVLRMTRKISKISTIYQWLPNEQRKISAENCVKVQRESAEFFWYLLEVSRRFGIDVAASLQKKIIKNAIKYPLPA